MRRRTASSSPPKAGRGNAGLRSFKTPSGYDPTAPETVSATGRSAQEPRLEAEARRELNPPGRTGRHRLPEERRAQVADDRRLAPGVERVEDAEPEGGRRSLFTFGPIERHLPRELEVEL